MGFTEQIGQLSREQLLELSQALHEEVLQLRPDEFTARSIPADVLYRTVWHEAPLGAAEPLSTPLKRMIIVDDGLQRTTEALAAAAQSRGVAVARLQLDASWSAATLEQRLLALRTQVGCFEAIVYCPRDTSSTSDAATLLSVWSAAFALSAAVVALGKTVGARLWFLTQAAQEVTLSGTSLDAGHAALNGLGKSLSLECPRSWGGCIDLDGATDSLDPIIHEIAYGADDEVAFRDGKRYLPALERAFLKKSPAIPVMRRDATYLVTGGMGGIGTTVVEHLLERGVSSLAIVSRHDEASYAREPEAFGVQLSTLQRWRSRYRSADILLLQADVADRSALAHVLAVLKEGRPPLRGVFHAAGTNDLVKIPAVTREAFDRIVAPKVLGALHLHELTQALPLDFQLYFSSVAGTWGTASMTLYALANRFLDGFCAYRNRRGFVTRSIAWGPWADVGMVIKQKQEALTSLGLRLMSPAEGLLIIDRILESGPAVAGCQALAGCQAPIVAVSIDWRRYGEALAHDRHLRPFRALIAASAASCASSQRSTAGTAGRHFADGRAMQSFLRTLIGELRGAELAAGDATRPLQELGLTSLLGVELSQRIQQQLGVVCRPTLVFDFPTVEALAAELMQRWSALRPGARDGAPAVAAAKDPEGDLIAIVGMGCRLPGASSPAGLWETLQRAGQTGRDLIQHAPAHRFDLQRYLSAEDAPGKAYTLSGGFLDDLAGFDHEGFQISRSEARFMDPQQRLALEVTWRAFEDANLDLQARNVDGADGDIGVFFGVGQNEYGPLCRSLLEDEHAGLMSTGQSMNIIAGRIAYLYGLRGPAITFDTACSSSLVALDAAVRHLRAGASRLAVVGGVNALISPDTFVLLSKARALSRSGRCSAFDADADGYVRSEGCVVLLLKRLADARADGNVIHAVIRGSAVNQDGRTNGLTAPSGRAQELLMRDALREAKLQPRQIALLEAHGTGTPLGDPIEYHALRSVYVEGAGRDRPLYLGSVKSLIGHTEAASGLAGLLKLVLCMSQRRLPAQVNYARLNPYIDASEHISIPTSSVALPPDGVLFGAVSAFGFSGTNAHVIVQQDGARPLEDRAVRTFSRVQCWYTSRPLPASTGLAQAFGARDGAGSQESQPPDGPHYYVKRWEPQGPVTTGGGVGSIGRVVLVCDGASAADRSLSYESVRQSLLAREIPVTEVEYDGLAGLSGSFDHVVVCLDGLQGVIQEARGAAVIDSVRAGYERLHAVLKAFPALHRVSGGSARLLVLTSHGGLEGDVDPYLASLLATFRQEHPALDATLASLEEGFEREGLPESLDSLLLTREPVSRVSCGGVSVPRLARIPERTGAPRFSGARTFIVTGGLGGLGTALIGWLLAHGARSVLNFNWHAPSAAQAAHFKELALRHGAEIRLVTLDVCDQEALLLALGEVKGLLPPVGGVFHCAGASDDSAIEEQDWGRVRQMVLPKFVGGWNLHVATLQEPVEHFVLFSSLAALLGSRHQAGYCLANSLLDGLAAHRRALRLPALAINWGPWSDVGMADRAGDELAARYRRLGLSRFSPARYLDALAHVMSEDAATDGGAAQVGIFELDWQRYREAEGSSPLYSHLATEPQRPGEAQSVSLSEALARVEPRRRLQTLRHLLKAIVAECLGLDDPGGIEDTRGFTELGVTSLHSSILHRKLEQSLRAAVVPTVSFDYPTPAALADFLASRYLQELFPAAADRAPADDAVLAGYSEAQLLGLLKQEAQPAEPPGALA